MKKNIVICGFPGIGKSYTVKLYEENENFRDKLSHALGERNLTITDSDSSKFSWLYDEEGNKLGRNPEFPSNYIGHIKSLLSEDSHGKIILTSTHQEVIEELNKNGIDFIMVFPKILLKKEYLKRYEDRGSPREFIELLSKNWNRFQFDCRRACHLSHCIDYIILNKGEFLNHALLILTKEFEDIL